MTTTIRLNRRDRSRRNILSKNWYRNPWIEASRRRWKGREANNKKSKKTNH